MLGTCLGAGLPATVAFWSRMLHKSTVFFDYSHFLLTILLTFINLHAFDPSQANGWFRRYLAVGARAGEGRLTERTPAVQPRRRERLKVPHTCRSR